jgi:asparagine synthase (glutamine-hydrolysing)
MCGIYGIVSTSLSKGKIMRRLKKMGELLLHRGPDDKKENIFQVNCGWLCFGFVRLSILDLETGMQPIICPKDGSAIICNGQIYNYIELKPGLSGEDFVSKGDVEVALHLYRRKGIDFLQELNGMYAGAIFDQPRNRFILFRDRFGIKPLYYTETDDCFVFSSEIKSLIAGSRLPLELNQAGLAAYFTYRYLPGEQTMFKNIKKLPPGSYLEFDLNSGVYTAKRYWEYKFDIDVPEISFDDAKEKFHTLLSDAVNIRLRSDVEVGALVSGGIDSSAVASMAADRKPNISLFTISFSEEKYNELLYVKKFLKANNSRFSSARLYTELCSRQALDQLPEIVRSIEEPISLGTILPTDQVCRLAGDRLKVVLTGEGADEIFGGYRKFLIEAAACQYHTLSSSRQKELDYTFPELKLYLAVRHKDPARRYIQSERLYSNDELKQLIGQDTVDNSFPGDALPSLSGREHPLNTAIAFEIRARLPDYVILRLDKLSMRHSLETRTPFLDYRLAEFAATLPVGFKVNIDECREKFICSHAYADFSVLDHETAFRKKQPFTIPLADWLAKPATLPDFLQEIMLGNIIKRQGILNQDLAREHMSKITVCGIGPQTLVSEADRIFSIIIFTLWYNEFFC